MNEVTNFKGETNTATDLRSADDHVAHLLTQVGDRVRKARERKGIPRRVLSEKSGVSPRYLAQLEAGECNISIGLLQRVAHALDHRIEWLMGEEDPWTSQSLRVAETFRAATAEVQDAVLRTLNPEPARSRRANRICLVGLRGAGKSTLGQMAGQSLGLPFVELNREIEEQAGMPVDEVIALYGQEGYRRLENQALARIIATHDAMVLAVAGGIVSEPDTYNLLLSRFHTVWIKALPEEHMSRVRAQGDERPMAGNPEAMEQLRFILQSREALYERAQAQLDTAGKPVDQSNAELLQLIEQSSFLD